MHNTSNVPIPAQMKHLPLWNGFPITHITIVNNGIPDFRTIDLAKVRKCMLDCLCGICGSSIDQYGWMCFIGSELSAQSREFSDPPMHQECAYYAAQVCPYLAGTKREFRPGPTKTEGAEDSMTFKMDEIKRPARMCVYKCKSYEVIYVADGKVPICVVDKRRSQIDWNVMPETRN